MRKRYKKVKKKGILMFLRKTERKRHSVCVILTIGALAAVGAITVTRSGKQILREATSKIKGFFKKDSCECQIDRDDCC